MASQNLGSLLYRIKAKNDRFKRGMRENRNEIKKTDRQVKKSQGVLKKYSRTFKQVGTALTVFGGIVTGVSFKLAKMASDANEIQSRFDHVFGELSKDANEWSENFAESFGQSRSEIKSMMATLQDTLVPMGVAEDKAYDLNKQITQLALDMSSFANVPLEQAMNDIQSALVGQSEPMRKYGSILTQTRVKQYALAEGIIETDRELSEQEKIIARVQLMMEDMTKATGDYERTQDSFANQLRETRNMLKNIGEEIGQNVLPTINSLLQKGKSLLEWFDDLPDSTQKAISKLTVFSGLLAGITGPMLLIIGYLPQIASGLAMVSSSFTPFLVGGAIAAGLAFIVNKFIEWRENVNLLKEDLKSLDQDSAKKRLELLQKDRQQLMQRAMIWSGPDKTWQEWIEENKKEEWENINNQIDATKNYIKELENQKELEKEIAEQKQKQMEYGAEITKRTNSLFQSLTPEKAPVQDYNNEWAIGNLEKAKEQLKTKSSKSGPLGQINFENLSEDKRTELIKKINDEILRLEHKQASKVEELNREVANKRSEITQNEYEHRINILEQEKQDMIDAYYEQLGSTQEYLEKKKEVEELYEGPGGLIDQVKEEQRQAEMREELKKQQFLLKQREITHQDYLSFLNEQIAAEEKHSDTWYQLMNERQNTLNNIVQNEMQDLKNKSNEMYDNENKRTEWLINQLKNLKTQYSDNKVIVALLNDEIKNLKNNITEDDDIELNWLEKTFNNIGYSVEEAQNKFQKFRNSVVDGFMDLIDGAKSFDEAIKDILDNLARMIVQKSIVEPFVDSILTGETLGGQDSKANTASSLFDFIASLGSAHSGGLVTANGVENIVSYHNGGISGMAPLEPDEKLVKTEVGELILTEDQQKGAINAQQSQAPIIIQATDAKSFADRLRQHGRDIVDMAGRDILENGALRDIIKDLR